MGTSRRGRPVATVEGPVTSHTRYRLLDACWGLLLDGKPATVAAVCRRADCTPPTLYHHFGDLGGLHRAACGRAFVEWSEALERRIASGADPAERLRQRGRAYVDWAVANPAAYRVLFVDAVAADGADEGPGAGFEPLLADLAALTGQTQTDPAVFVAALAHWSAVHGLACLAISRPDLPADVRTATLEHLASALASVAVPIERGAD